MTGINDSHTILKKLKRSVLLPYVLLLFSALSLLSLILFSADNLNKFSKHSTEQLFNNVIKKELDSLANQLKDYASWYDAVNNLIIHYDPFWVESNLQQSLKDSYSITRVMIVKTDYSTIISIHNGVLEQYRPIDLMSADMEKLYEQAFSQDMHNPSPVTAYLWIGQQIHLVAVSPITSDLPADGIEQNKAYGLMVFTKQLDKVLLKKWAKQYQFNDIQLNKKQPQTTTEYVTIDLFSPLKRWLGSVTIKPDHPGEIFIKQVIPWVILFLFITIFISLLFIYRVKKYTEIEKQALNDLHDSQKQLHISQKQLQNVIEGAHLGYWDWDLQTGALQVNDQWLEFLGLSRDDIKNGVSDRDSRVHPDDRERMRTIIEAHIQSGLSYCEDLRMKHKNGHWVWIQCSGSVVEYHLDSGKAKRLCGTHQDIDKRKEAENLLKEKATHDHLTGLYNRQEMENYFIQELERSHRHNRHVSVFMVDIDYFKQVNDKYGHQAGDKVLKILARFMSNTIRTTDFIARFGGEEFVIILPETALDDAIELAGRLHTSVSHLPIPMHSEHIKLTISIGVASFPENGNNYEELINKADLALYEAKQTGRNCVRHACNKKSNVLHSVVTNKKK